MNKKKEEVPLDARLLSDVIIEIDISRRNVSIYPKGHPVVEKSLLRAFDFLQKLFELRSEITLNVAKDKLIVNDYCLDKKNPVYKAVALCLSRVNIAYVTFMSGLTKEELYTFHQFIAREVNDASPEALEAELKKYNLLHIKTGFIDYSSFSFNEGKTENDLSRENLWEQYVHGLIEGTLQTGVQSNVLDKVPPEALARLLNENATDDLKEDSYERVITTYLKKSSERNFSSKDLKKLMEFINELRPELKKQFLSASARTLSKDTDSVEKILKDTSADEVIEFLNAVNEQKMVIPETLKNLLDKFSMITPDGFEDFTFGDGRIADDILLSPETINMLFGDNFENFVSDTYTREINALLEFNAPSINVDEVKKFECELSDENIEKDFNHTILELITSDNTTIIPQEDYEYFNNILKEQIEECIGTGQYEQVLKIFNALQLNDSQKKRSHIAIDEFISPLVDSLRIVGRQSRENAMLLCEYFGERIASLLINALIEEEAITTRRFILSLLIRLGDKAVPEAIKRLGDRRWFVKRNMLLILNECGGKDAVSHIKPYCHHNHPKVSFQAIKYLLNAGESYGIEELKDCLSSGSRDIVEQAIVISGAYRVKDVVPDLITMLKKKVKSAADVKDKILIVKALGQIGDPRALDTLRNILAAKNFLLKGPFEKLKVEIYRTLKNYPCEQVKDLIETDDNSKYLNTAAKA
jgi:HEAT repeat protein